jgi:ArsR family transcriptional regulator
MAARPAPRRPEEAGEALAESGRRAAHVADVLKAVAHPLRIRIVATLCRGEEHVSGLADKLGAPQAIVSQQLRILRLHHLVAVRRASGFARYRLAEPQLRSLVSCMERCEGS